MTSVREKPWPRARGFTDRRVEGRKLLRYSTAGGNAIEQSGIAKDDDAICIPSAAEKGTTYIADALRLPATHVDTFEFRTWYAEPNRFAVRRPERVNCAFSARQCLRV